MFNPSDLEGEVDHSFFDSDCDDNSISRDGGKKMEKGLKAEERSPQERHERLHAKQTENTKGAWSPRADATNKHLKPLKNNRSNREEKKESCCQSKEEVMSRSSSMSSVAYTSDRAIKNFSDGEEDSNSHSKRPSGAFMTLLAEAREVDCKDVSSSQSPNESEEEVLQYNSKHSKGKNKKSLKKGIRNRRTRSPSPTSTETSLDADSESSSSSSNASRSLDSPTLPRPNKSSLSPGVRRNQVSSARSQDLTDRPNKSSLSPGVRRNQVSSARSQDLTDRHTEESDDTVTDVSPLSSPGCSPLQSVDLDHAEAGEGSFKEQQKKSVSSSDLQNIHQREDSDQDVDDCSIHSDSLLGDELVLCCPGRRHRKNYSFTNDEVKSIDLENQRLLRVLSRLSAGPRPGGAEGKKTRVACNSPVVRLSHSALNRQREQQRIERENLAFLKRLESIKPTPGLKRSEQLADYQRYSSYPMSVSTTKVVRPTRKTPSAGSRPISSAHHSSRAVSASTNSSNTPTPRSKKLNAARPAWC